MPRAPDRGTGRPARRLEWNAGTREDILSPMPSALTRRLQKHFGRNPFKLPVVEQMFGFHERPNLHLAIQELVEGVGRKTRLTGIVMSEHYENVTLSKLSRAVSAAPFEEGPVEYADVPVAADRNLACVKRGLYTLTDGKAPVALLVSEQQFARQSGITIEVMGLDREAAEGFVRRLTRLTRAGKAYRGQILSLERDCYGAFSVRFHSLPSIGRDGIILPPEVLRRIERHTLGFSRHADVLRSAGRHLKRGILLHGPPGTGKTLTAMHLASQMAGRTVLIMTGSGMGSIEIACSLARLLEPATVILEDVDLIGTERQHQSVDANALLFELLNQMDGLSDDADVLFILTTNRPDVLEPALASRPGRIDQAIEIPLPDADCRRRLLELYARGLTLDPADRDRLVEPTAGASGAFIRELLRKATVIAAEENGQGPLAVRDRHLDEALAELLVAGGALTQSLLGARVKGEKPAGP
jgi:cell division protease FtsH